MSITEEAPARPIVITEPGLYDIPEADYHADPVPGGSLSCSIAKKLVGDCPAIARHALDNPPAHKDAWDLGSVLHGLVLGRGGKPAVFPGSWNTNEIKEKIRTARAAGLVPLKPEALDTAKSMATAVANHPIAGPLFDSPTGLAERTIIWNHERTGTPMRSMLDWLDLAPGLPPLIVDLKSTKDVSPRGIRKDISGYRYYQQDAFYRSAVASLGHDPQDVGFVFVFVGSTPPHLVTVAMLRPDYVAEGWMRNEQAIDLWIKCTKTGLWPGYTADIEEIEIPGWMA